MKNRPFHFEIKEILMQFAAALNNIIIGRYAADGTREADIKVPFIYQPKGRTIHDIVNKQGNLNLPVISFYYTSIKYNASREKNKKQDFYVMSAGGNPVAVKHAVPIDISISLAIMCKYSMDLDQIIQNFVVNSTPYIVLEWRIPHTVYNANGVASVDEYIINVNVQWSGAVNVDHKIELANNEKDFVTADTTFTIEGWLFRQSENEAKRIEHINSSFDIPSDCFPIYTSWDEMLAGVNPDETESFTIPAASSSPHPEEN